MIDAEFRSEERFSRLALAFTQEDEEAKINDCIKEIVNKYDFKPEIHETSTSNGKKIIIIEYHDDIDREAGDIFEQIIKELDVKQCN